jgi:Fungal specific transcription factor domain/Fungal Zn(2)-Cys(6) binuclear cluster domain
MDRLVAIIPLDDNSHSRRACAECNRKKTKCDMKRPKCGLCQRVGAFCTFPTQRRNPGVRKASRRTSSIDDAGSNARSPRWTAFLEANLTAGEDLLTHTSNSFRPHLVQASTQQISPPNDHSLSEIPQITRPEAWERGPNASQHDSRPFSPNISSAPDTDGSGRQLSSQPDSCKSQSGSREQIDLPNEVALELIDIYFDKVQAWLPLLHRPRFYRQFVSSEQTPTQRASCLEDRLILQGIFALSARYSTSHFFSTVSPLDRGKKFADEARALYIQKRTDVDPPNLAYLQGCILLAFYYYASGPCPRGWLLTGACVGLAYDLDLSSIDEDEGLGLDTEEWASREELRRAWWLVWELDTFGSTISNRPYMIDRRRMSVLLPCSDDAWYAETPLASAKLEWELGKAWKTLQGCPNQCERAWFLVANQLMSLINDLSHRRNGVSLEEKAEAENAVSCFLLVMPASFHLDGGSFWFDTENFARSNWIICAHLMMAAPNLLISNISVKGAHPQSPGTQMRLSQLERRASAVTRIVRHWSAEFIWVAHPFIACLLLPIHIEGEGNEVLHSPEDSASHELVQLILDHFGRAWRLGNVLLNLAILLESPNTVTSNDLELARRFAVYFPRTPKSTTSRRMTATSQIAGSQPGSITQDPRTLKATDHVIEEPPRSEPLAVSKAHRPQLRQKPLVARGTYDEESSNDQRTQQPSEIYRGATPTEFLWADNRDDWNSSIADFFGQMENLDFMEF